jgi:hypothetical protein
MEKKIKLNGITYVLFPEKEITVKILGIPIFGYTNNSYIPEKAI